MKNKTNADDTGNESNHDEVTLEYERKTDEATSTRIRFFLKLHNY